MLDLHAPIEPGQAAAGFKIGQSLSSIEPFLKDVCSENYVPGFPLNAVLAENKGTLVVRRVDPRGGVSIFFGSDAVRLVFSAYGQLACIYVFDGYLGSYRGVRIGEMLSMISITEPIGFNDGDEMYYRLDGERQYIPGFAVVAGEARASEHASPRSRVTASTTGLCSESGLNEATSLRPPSFQRTYVLHQIGISKNWN